MRRVVLWVLRWGVQLALALRYRVTVVGAAAVRARGRRGIIFLPNHPALVDPLIVVTFLHRDFQVRPLADRDQIDRPIVRWLARQVGVVPIRDVKAYGQEAAADVAAAQATLREELGRGGGGGVYPSGHLMRGPTEMLRGNSGAHALVQSARDARVVLVRTTGVWGSCSSKASGRPIDLRRQFWRRVGDVLLSFVFFVPRRHVRIELREVERSALCTERRAFNAQLQAYYNEVVSPNLYVAYRLGERPVRRVLPEPAWRGVEASAASVAPATRAAVLGQLREMSGVAALSDSDRLAHDLGLDSLARSELLLWIGREFGHRLEDPEALETVADVLQAAAGAGTSRRDQDLIAPPGRWQRQGRGAALALPAGTRLGEVFLATARRRRGDYIIADQRSGALTYRKLLTGILLLSERIAALPGERVGIMLPASVGATVAYWATLFAGKTPVMVNWTTGVRNVEHILELTQTEKVLTARELVSRLEHQELDLRALQSRFVYLDDVRAGISTAQQLVALVKATLGARGLDPGRIPDQIVILMTSGSETRPKGVPLTQRNVLTNIRDVLDMVAVYDTDRLLGFLPPFHSFGLTATTVLPTVLGVPTAYYPNPTEAALLGRMVETYGITFMLGTPSFLGAILRAATAPEVLGSLRLAVTGAEKCSPQVYDALRRKAPQAVVLEGYGITECSPVVSVNDPQKPKEGTIGKVLRSFEHVIVDAETDEPVQRGARGVLLVRGPCVFEGYVDETRESPFVAVAGKTWYRTGDLVTEDEDGVLTFQGRLKRFVKIGGEMVSLPAIEAALWEHFADESDEGPPLAVVARETDHQAEIVLFTTRETERQGVNRLIRGAGLSAIHNVAAVRQVDEIPLLGNGKTDYRALEGRLDEGGAD